MALARPLDTEALRQVGEWTRPLALAGEQLLGVLEPLGCLFPEGGIRRGSTITVAGGPGATSLALALGAAASAGGSWVAAVNLPSLGWLAAAELGVALERVVVVAGVEPAAWAGVVAALLDAVDLVWVGLSPRVGDRDARRLAARARERGSVLVVLDPWLPESGGRSPKQAWPARADVRLQLAPSPTWIGPTGQGAGRLEARRVEVVAGGRGASARPRRQPLWLPAPDGTLTPTAPTPTTPPRSLSDEQ